MLQKKETPADKLPAGVLRPSLGRSIRRTQLAFFFRRRRAFLRVAFLVMVFLLAFFRRRAFLRVAFFAVAFFRRRAFLRVAFFRVAFFVEAFFLRAAISG